MPNTTISFTYNDTDDFSPMETLLYYMQMDEENAAFNEALKEDAEREIFDDVPFPTKDRRKRERRFTDRDNHINRRKAIYRNRLVGKVRKGDCDAWLPYKYEEHYPEGQLADGKGKIFEGDSKFTRSFKKINPSWNEEKTDATAREALKDFYKSEGNRVYGYDEDDWDDEYEYEEDYDDTRYEDELFEEEKAEIFRRINEVKTIADAIYLSADFAREAAFHEEYGIHEWGDLYKYGISVLATEMSRREWEQYY